VRNDEEEGEDHATEGDISLPQLSPVVQLGVTSHSPSSSGAASDADPRGVPQAEEIQEDSHSRPEEVQQVDTPKNNIIPETRSENVSESGD
jgi:hypothetical protein